MHPILFWHNGHLFATYSLLVWLGYIVGALWLKPQLKRQGITPPQFWGMIAAVLSGALIGGKLGFFIVEWRDFWTNPLAMLREWNTGWVFWSGLLSAMAAGLAYQWWHNRHYPPRAYLPVADYCVAALSIGHVLGRLGCFMEGCCHGRLTSLPWGVVFTSAACSVADNLKGLPLHPTQLYEAFGEAIAAVAMIGWLLPRIRSGVYRYGTAFFGYILYYSILRFIGECFRGDDRGIFISPLLSPSQWTALFCTICVAMILWKRGLKETDASGRSYFLGRK